MIYTDSMFPFFEVPIIPVIAAALLAVALGNVWYAFLDYGRDATDYACPESVQATLWNVLAHLVLFFVLAQLLRLVDAGYINLGTLSILISIPAALQHAQPMIMRKRSFRAFLVHATYTIFVMVGGLAVIAYWPW